MIEQSERYQRQTMLDGFGIEAQAKLAQARVLVIGAGGLGCPILQYLAAAGIGHIGMADDDKVSYSNLHRQILYGQEDIGQYKVLVAASKLHALNNEIRISVYQQRWSQSLAIEFFPEYDVIVDATDNFASRYLINDACVLINKPLVFGAVSKYEGQVAIFNVKQNDVAINYRDLFPNTPKNEEVLSCSEAGVLGVLPGIIGVMQATEVIKLITGIGKPLINQMLHYNALTHSMYVMDLIKNTTRPLNFPLDFETFLNTDYTSLCETAIHEIAIDDWIPIKDNLILVDVRELDELPRIHALAHLSIPLGTLHLHLDSLQNKDIVFVCQTGIRSKKAAALLKITYQKVYSLSGGVKELVQKNIL